VVLVVGYRNGVAGPHVTPAALSRAGAIDCKAWNLGGLGGSTYEVHLRVPVSDVNSTKEDLRGLVGNVVIRMVSPEFFADAPTDGAVSLARSQPLTGADEPQVTPLMCAVVPNSVRNGSGG
jgi:hypothetical protein